MNDASAPRRPLTSAGVPFQPEQEIRFAVVMYGGVSLAIYMHGVAQELLKLVRATAPDAPFRPVDEAAIDQSPTRGTLLTADSGAPVGHRLTGSERVYRRLGQMLPLAGGSDGLKRPPDGDPIRTRFVIDIISGTSAGGINGVFLAKALARNVTMDALKALWVKEGDIAALINDSLSYVDDLKDLRAQNPPASLLNSQRMYCKLLDALKNMDPGPTHGNTPLVDELDLYVTATDIEGLVAPIRLSGRVVSERRYKNVFRFRYANDHASGDPADDFQKVDDPFLAYAARCTSAFPFAFEPMTLGDIDPLLQLEAFRRLGFEYSSCNEWRRFYRDYLQPDPSETEDDLSRRFVAISFGDGGYLDNKPFGHAIAALQDRRADFPVDRKLLYIEPSPEHPESEPSREGKPDAIENVRSALLALPRQETIREDLDRIGDYNRLVDRVRVILRERDADVRELASATGANKKGGPSVKGWREGDLTVMTSKYGIAYGAYHRLKVAVVTDELARKVAGLYGFNENSQEMRAIRYLIGEWRDRTYVRYRRAGESTDSENMFLFQFDIWWRLRRLAFVESRIDELLLLGLDQVKERLAGVSNATIGTSPSEVAESSDFLRQFRAALRLINWGLTSAHADLRKAERRLGTRNEDTKGLMEAVNGLEIGERLAEVFTQPSHGQRQQKAARIVTERFEGFKRVADELRTLMANAMRPVGETCEVILGLPPRPNDPPGRDHRVDSRTKQLAERLTGTIGSLARTALTQFYLQFEEYDLVSFPVLYGTDVGEIAPVEVTRISPEDANDLYDEREGTRRRSPREVRERGDGRERAGCGQPKLAGAALGHFGAFLDARWRTNDMLWGRLDTVESIVGAVMPPEAPAVVRADLIREAQEAILEEELSTNANTEATRLLATALDRCAEDGCDREGRGWLREYAGTTRTVPLTNVLAACLDRERLPAFFLESSQRNRALAREATLRSAARATEVVGKILESVAAGHPPLRPAAAPLRLVVWLGRIFWGLVEIAVPRSLGNALSRHWLWLLYGFEVLTVVLGLLFGRQGAISFGLTAFGATFAVHSLLFLLNSQMRSGRGLTIVKIAGGLVLLALITFGGLYAGLHLTSDIRHLGSWVRGMLPGAEH